MFEFHLSQWARDPVKGYEPLLRQQGLRLGKTSYQYMSQAYSADGIFLPAKNKGLVPISWKILQCCSRASLYLFTLLCEFTSGLRNLGAGCCQVPPGVWGFPPGRSRGPQTPPHTQSPGLKGGRQPLACSDLSLMSPKVDQRSCTSFLQQFSMFPTVLEGALVGRKPKISPASFTFCSAYSLRIFCVATTILGPQGNLSFPITWVVNVRKHFP